MKKKLKKYSVLSSETVYETYEVEAYSEKEARETVLNGEMDALPGLSDSSDFEVVEVEEIRER